MAISFTPGDAFLAVDLQYDFFPGGSLGVPEGDQIIPVINQYIADAKKANVPIFASRDWHPKNHISFKEQGGPWPPHCVQNTQGAKFHHDIQLPDDIIVVNKAFDEKAEAYSALEGKTDKDNRPLADVLRENNIKRIWIGGLALDYCVFASAMDAVKAGFDVHVLLPGTRAIDTQHQDEVLEELTEAGVKIEQ